MNPKIEVCIYVLPCVSHIFNTFFLLTITTIKIEFEINRDSTAWRNLPFS